jgi:L-amino acid N-acyltransferase YncA
MPPKTLIRSATMSDLAVLNDIYNHYVANSVCTYDELLLSLEDRRRWFEAHDSAHPVVVAEAQEEIVGFGALSHFRQQGGFRITAENALYVRHDTTGHGIGSAILADLITRARAIGYRAIVAVIDAEQASSIRLHERHGFVRCAHLRQVGFKRGRWLDVIYLELLLPVE